jgi:cytosine/adenosine deaminase-related metal-dependent hydrolase
MEYREVRPLGRQDAEAARLSGNNRDWVDAMLGIARYDPDRKWAEDYLLARTYEPSDAVQWGAVQALAELARNGGITDRSEVMRRLRELLNHPKIGGIAGDAIDDLIAYSDGDAV